MKVNFKTNPEQFEKAQSAREFRKTDRVTVVANSSRAGKPIKSNLSLPQEVIDNFNTIKDKKVRNDYVRALRAKGWTYSSIAKAVGVTTEMIRNIASKPYEYGVPEYFLIPEVPTHPEKVVKGYTLPSDELLERLKELQPYAQLVRSSSMRYRAEAEEYAFLLNKATEEQGVTVYRLAKLLGITPSAIAFRLVRYGYRSTVNGKTKAYQSIKDSNRFPSSI